MKKRIVVKIGSNALTRPDGRLDVTRMSAPWSTRLRGCASMITR